MSSSRFLGLDPVPVPGHVFSVDGGRLRYARFERDEGELSLRDYHGEDLGENAFMSGPLGGVLREPERFYHAVEALLGRLSEVPEEASLVVPDQWLRVAFTGMEKLPRGTDTGEVLRFKLKRLVPFRVEDLRVSAAEVPSMGGGQGSEKQMMLGFAIESLLAQLEDGFERHGITIGHVSNSSLAVLPALTSILGGGLGVLAHVATGSYSLMLTVDGHPVLYRFKLLGADPATQARLVPRDLGLTSSFVRQELKGRRLSELVLVAPAGVAETWKVWLEEAFEHPVRSLAEDWPALPGSVADVPSWEVLPLFGAASRGVS